MESPVGLPLIAPFDSLAELHASQSPDNSPPHDENTTVINQPDLLSPEHAHNPLPAKDLPIRAFTTDAAGRGRTLPPLNEFTNFPAQFVPAPSSSSTTSASGHRRHRSRSKTPARAAYEAAPVPDGMEYPASPLVQIAVPEKYSPPRVDELPPLSPLAGEGFLGFAGKIPRRRYTSDR